MTQGKNQGLHVDFQPGLEFFGLLCFSAHQGSSYHFKKKEFIYQVSSVSKVDGGEAGQGLFFVLGRGALDHYFSLNYRQLGFWDTAEWRENPERIQWNTMIGLALESYRMVQSSFAKSSRLLMRQASKPRQEEQRNRQIADHTG